MKSENSFPSKSYLHNLLPNLFFFGLGVVAGVISTSYLQALQRPIQWQWLSSFPPLPNSYSPPPSFLPLCLHPPPINSPRHLPALVTSPSPPPPPAKILRMEFKDYIAPHDMNDEELIRRASMVPRVTNRTIGQVPKVAFLFLVRGEIPFAPLWEKFFKGHEGLYSIYVHPDPSYKGTAPEDSVFHGRRVPSKAVKWGHISMMEAERRLLANALLELSNQRFVLLSEACIPLFNLTTIHSYLTNSAQSFIEVYDQHGPTGRGRYKKHMKVPQITMKQWRKGSQWFEMDRDLAVEVISDDVYFPIFKRRCKSTSCYVDEHYLPTFVHMKFGWKNANRSVTWVDWSKGGPHPARINRPEVSPDSLRWMRSGGSECIYNGRKTKMCYLFARKFLPNSLIRLEFYAPSVLGFGG